MESVEIELLPKAVVHEHLDGGLRVGTILELADEAGHRLPADDEASLADWFHQGDAESLEEYLEAFERHEHRGCRDGLGCACDRDSPEASG